MEYDPGQGIGRMAAWGALSKGRPLSQGLVWTGGSGLKVFRTSVLSGLEACIAESTLNLLFSDIAVIEPGA